MDESEAHPEMKFHNRRLVRQDEGWCIQNTWKDKEGNIWRTQTPTSSPILIHKNHCPYAQIQESA